MTTRYRNSFAYNFIAFIMLCIAPASVLAQIGMRNIQVGDIPVTLVYATDEIAKPQTLGVFQIDVAVNAKPKAGNQRLIVMSHGTGGSAIPDYQLAATLAKAGYLVAQPMHAGDNYKDASKAGPESWKTRPLEVSKAIDALSKDPTWSRLFDASKVGVHGMSAGGVTAIALAGGQWNILTMLRHCAKESDADAGFCFNGLAQDAAAQTKRRTQFQAAAKAPEIYLPAELKQLQGTLDVRVKAITLAVPLVAPFTASTLAAITIPVGVVSATNDGVLTPAFHSSYLLDKCKSCTRLVDLKHAGHFDVLAPWPADVAAAVSKMQVRPEMPHPQFHAPDRQVAFDTIVTFFDSQLR